MTAINSARVMTWPGDEDRPAELNVFLAHTPKGS